MDTQVNIDSLTVLITELEKNLAPLSMSSQIAKKFLVLDETFGALDRDRRSQLLDLLASLPQQTASFQQLFIISHVDDVRSAPIFSQVWHIAENDTGASEVQDLGHGARIEDL